ncbi:hypothetical protein CEXT_455621 [Caerostris extrusa]|uniref:Uncharacterized protein n=1 Tax=Caerostris extrusa TaxID=172846 RepID=A0AAV4NAM8_CAEEX|nr:hypothetical protein CEXT_455621 [Caerostris extrusa]
MRVPFARGHYGTCLISLDKSLGKVQGLSEGGRLSATLSLLINHFRGVEKGRTSQSLIQCPGVNAAISYSSTISISPIAN